MLPLRIARPGTNCGIDLRSTPNWAKSATSASWKARRCWASEARAVGTEPSRSAVITQWTPSSGPSAHTRAMRLAQLVTGQVGVLGGKAAVAVEQQHDQRQPARGGRIHLAPLDDLAAQPLQQAPLAFVLRGPDHRAEVRHPGQRAQLGGSEVQRVHVQPVGRVHLPPATGRWCSASSSSRCPRSRTGPGCRRRGSSPTGYWAWASGSSASANGTTSPRSPAMPRGRPEREQIVEPELGRPAAAATDAEAGARS